MGLLLLAGAEQSVVLNLLLLASVGLAFWETRELDLDNRQSLWWVLAVVLLHVPAYLVFRVWGARQRRDATT